MASVAAADIVRRTSGRGAGEGDAGAASSLGSVAAENDSPPPGCSGLVHPATSAAVAVAAATAATLAQARTDMRRS
ncbi:hypothetical protein AERYTH_04645 [Aeromicrobium erythreum]|uniref:Uncharacterized protein n=1 Tax=Aeromicrobium erythreum TaxID=2041 RepID=A0A0U3KG94_9ACTN|nr:hypothetical protein AERYTH_04645 [Aeromicrobium erythreum]